ncbi:MAG: hypothetical protein QM495_11515 [Lutibacter sp.]|uniref:hypothetical protein n=1 Tax=Lutibacter sp. TaxID=1925666 RepID=UPI00385D5A25
MKQKEIDSFVTYELNEKDKNFIQEVVKETLRNVKPKAFNCALLSALLGAMIYDNSDIPVVVLSGHFEYNSNRIFNCTKPIPFTNKEKMINDSWDGHCWIEINDLIIDLSIFRTIYYGKVPNSFKTEIVEKFGAGKGALIGYSSCLKELGFNYIPKYSLNQEQINGLIKGLSYE